MPGAAAARGAGPAVPAAQRVPWAAKEWKRRVGELWLARNIYHIFMYARAPLSQMVQPVDLRVPGVSRVQHGKGLRPTLPATSAPSSVPAPPEGAGRLRVQVPGLHERPCEQPVLRSWLRLLQAPLEAPSDLRHVQALTRRWQKLRARGCPAGFWAYRARACAALAHGPLSHGLRNPPAKPQLVCTPYLLRHRDCTTPQHTHTQAAPFAVRLGSRVAVPRGLGQVPAFAAAAKPGAAVTGPALLGRLPRVLVDAMLPLARCRRAGWRKSAAGRLYTRGEGPS